MHMLKIITHGIVHCNVLVHSCLFYHGCAKFQKCFINHLLMEMKNYDIAPVMWLTGLQGNTIHVQLQYEGIY